MVSRKVQAVKHFSFREAKKGCKAPDGFHSRGPLAGFSGRVGFDKVDRNKAGISAAASASPESFGHSGFTGTYTWIDPSSDLVYVFLSNRVYPTRNNSKISDMNIRTGINEVIYQAIKKGN